MANDNLMKPIKLLGWTESRKPHTVSCLFQLECRGDHVHPSCRFPSLLAQEADANAAHDPSRKLRVHLSRVGRPFGHCQRPGASGNNRNSGTISFSWPANEYKPTTDLLTCLNFQISRLLVVNPETRYTATDALNHPFFQQYVVAEVRHFSPYRKFKVGSVIIDSINYSNCWFILHIFAGKHFTALLDSHISKTTNKLKQWIKI